MVHSKSERLVIAVVFTIALVLNLLLMGCAIPTEDRSVQPPILEHSVPVKIALFQDKSGSTGWTRTPQLTDSTLKIILDLVKERSGELAFGLLRDRSNKGLVRLRIDGRPAQPAKPTKTRRVYQDARAMGQYRKEEAEYDAALATWQADTDRRVAAFTSDLRPLLDQPSDSRCTSIWEAVARGDLYLSEDDASWPTKPAKWAIYVTDGIHNCGPGRTASLKSGAGLIVINGEAQTGSLGPLQPKVFESIESAFRYLQATEGGK